MHLELIVTLNLIMRGCNVSLPQSQGLSDEALGHDIASKLHSINPAWRKLLPTPVPDNRVLEERELALKRRAVLTLTTMEREVVDVAARRRAQGEVVKELHAQLRTIVNPSRNPKLVVSLIPKPQTRKTQS